MCNAAFERNVYELPSPMDYQILHEAAEPLEYDIRNGLDISSTSTSFRGPTQDLPCPQLHSLYSEELHRQQPFPPHHYIEQSYYSPRPVNFFSYIFWSNFQQLFARSKMRRLYIFRLTIIISIHLKRHRSTSLILTPAQFLLKNRRA